MDQNENQIEKNVFDAMYNRRSIRSYVEGKEVEHEKIIKLLKAGMAAPSACNLQPWEFIIITGKEALIEFKSCLGGGKYNAPLAFVVCGNTSYIPWEGDTGTIDCSAAIENMMLAATVMGLGSVWIGDYDATKVCQLLDIPSHVVPISVVLFGYPAEQKAPRTQYNEAAIFWHKYDPNREHKPRGGV